MTPIFLCLSSLSYTNNEAKHVALNIRLIFVLSMGIHSFMCKKIPSSSSSKPIEIPFQRDRSYFLELCPEVDKIFSSIRFVKVMFGLLSLIHFWTCFNLAVRYFRNIVWLYLFRLFHLSPSLSASVEIMHRVWGQFIPSRVPAYTGFLCAYILYVIRLCNNFTFMLLFLVL